MAIHVVIAELAVISWVRHRYMDTPPLSAAMQVGLGGALVFLVGWLIGFRLNLGVRRHLPDAQSPGFGQHRL